jgi:hypothetical protein
MMASIAAIQNGTAARSFAADAHGCIMVGSELGPAEYKAAAR